MMPTRSRKPPEALLALAAAAALALSACAPGAPEGVDKATLDDAVSRAIGTPNTCLLIAEADGGDVVYRYNSATACDKAWPTCEPAGGTRKLKDLLAAAVKDRQPRTASCDSADPTRNVAWAAGPVAGKPLVYAAVMEGEPERTFPGLIMADRIGSAFARAGLSPKRP